MTALVVRSVEGVGHIWDRTAPFVIVALAYAWSALTDIRKHQSTT